MNVAMNDDTNQVLEDVEYKKLENSQDNIYISTAFDTLETIIIDINNLLCLANRTCFGKLNDDELSSISIDEDAFARLSDNMANLNDEQCGLVIRTAIPDSVIELMNYIKLLTIDIDHSSNTRQAQRNDRDAHCYLVDDQNNDYNDKTMNNEKPWDLVPDGSEQMKIFATRIIEIILTVIVNFVMHKEPCKFLLERPNGQSFAWDVYQIIVLSDDMLIIGLSIRIMIAAIYADTTNINPFLIHMFSIACNKPESDNSPRNYPEWLTIPFPLDLLAQLGINSSNNSFTALISDAISSIAMGIYRIIHLHQSSFNSGIATNEETSIYDNTCSNITINPDSTLSHFAQVTKNHLVPFLISAISKIDADVPDILNHAALYIEHPMLHVIVAIENISQLAFDHFDHKYTLEILKPIAHIIATDRYPPPVTIAAAKAYLTIHQLATQSNHTDSLWQPLIHCVSAQNNISMVIERLAIHLEKNEIEQLSNGLNSFDTSNSLS